MPELPEVETIARDLAGTIIGARVVKVWGSGFPLRLARAIDLEAIRRVSEARRIVDVRRKAKYLLIEFERAGDHGGGPPRPGVLFHLGMSGRLLVWPAPDHGGESAQGVQGVQDAQGADDAQGVEGADDVQDAEGAQGEHGAGALLSAGANPSRAARRSRVARPATPPRSDRPPHTHLAFTFGDGRELRFRDPRRFGWIAAGAPVDDRPELSGLGPDPLTELDAGGLAARLTGVRAPIKAFLLDQSRVAGLGNIYVCEALHRAGIHPSTPAARARGRVDKLLAGIRAALELGIANRGTTLRDYVDSFGAGGNNAAALRAYGREGQPCPTCDAPIRRRVDSARSTFFCAHCQRR